MPSPSCRSIVAALALAAACGAAVARGVAQVDLPPAASSDDDKGALIGELVFQADLMSALDRLCPRLAASIDWHGALAALEREAMTPELLALSRRLGADAGKQLVRERGGCHTTAFSQAYGESREEYRALLERWNTRAP